MKIYSVVLFFLLLVVAIDSFPKSGRFRQAKKEFLSRHRSESEIERVCEKVAKYKEKVSARLRQRESKHKWEHKSRQEETNFDNGIGNITTREAPNHCNINRGAGIEECALECDIIPNEQQIDALHAIFDAEKEELTDLRQKRGAAYRNQNFPKFWPKSPICIPYYFDASITATTKSLIRLSLQYWQNHICLCFTENSVASANKIRFFKGSGCWSYIGNNAASGWTSQDLSIGAGCEHIGIITHEVGHALGFFHEQSRYDRDSYVSLNLNNIDPNNLHNFNKETTATNNNYGVQYDYGSVMHYSEAGFAINSNITVIRALESPYQRTMGSRATTNWQFFDVTVGQDNLNILDTFTSCWWWIQAPTGYKVQIQLVGVGYVSSDGCFFGFSEIKLGNFERTGFRVCTGADVSGSPIYTSATNLAMIGVYTRYYYQRIQLNYRYVA
uniref:Zinc metalloproteinase n=1 Tax=Acrobeloides nanus TaxID=290746 RepID=A0A914EF97_9BILA